MVCACNETTVTTIGCLTPSTDRLSDTISATLYRRTPDASGHHLSRFNRVERTMPIAVGIDLAAVGSEVVARTGVDYHAFVRRVLVYPYFRTVELRPASRHTSQCIPMKRACSVGIKGCRSRVCGSALKSLQSLPPASPPDILRRPHVVVAKLGRVRTAFSNAVSAKIARAEDAPESDCTASFGQCRESVLPECDSLRIRATRYPT